MDPEPADPNKRVFHILRVSSKVPSSHNRTSKPQVLYNGISANTWFSPFGITQKKSMCHARSFMLIPDACIKTVEDRAKTASSIMGKRHFELDRQTLGKEEILQGMNMLSKQDYNKGLDPDKGEDNHKEQRKVCFVDDKHHNVISDGNKRRYPKLSYGAERRPKTAPSILNVPCPAGCAVLPGLSVRQIMVASNTTLNNMVNKNELRVDKKQRCVSAVEVRACSGILKDVSTTFRSVVAMREAYQAKVSMDQANIDQNIEINCRKDVVDNEIASELSAKEQHKGIYHHRMGKRVITPRNRFEHGEKTDIPRSVLKPLLYNEELELKHSAECPYNCPGCFRACLASDDYLEKAEEQMKEKLRKQKARMRPRSVWYGPKPKAHLRVIKRETPRNEIEFKDNMQELECFNIESIE